MKILIIKLGADGDVIRTLPIAKAIKDKYPEAELHWLTRGDISSILENVPYIDKVHALPFNLNQKFNILYNFDIERAALVLAKNVLADKKYGFYKEGDYPASFNLGAEYYLNTVFDDEIKKTNKKTYQEMMFNLAELPVSNERYDLPLTEEQKRFAENYRETNHLKENIIGIHMGASSRWPSKVWHPSEMKRFISLVSDLGFDVILFGGPNEADTHPAFVQELARSGANIHRNNPHNSKEEFIALLSLCSRVICSDSLALHIAIGLGKKVTCLFFCTSPDEVEGYGLLTKVVSPKLYDFFPEKSDQYDENLVKSITAEQVIQTLE